mmetsp:Transcript_4342/g.7915  ORF Transcript_4342/g.7915 Transcript_4342/m.7915 type:complete len:120 (-) Transcript_4342:213-572(-)
MRSLRSHRQIDLGESAQFLIAKRPSYFKARIIRKQKKNNQDVFLVRLRDHCGNLQGLSVHGKVIWNSSLLGGRTSLRCKMRFVEQHFAELINSGESTGTYLAAMTGVNSSSTTKNKKTK